jgi:hypothetical protein
MFGPGEFDESDPIFSLLGAALLTLRMTVGVLAKLDPCKIPRQVIAFFQSHPFFCSYDFTLQTAARTALGLDLTRQDAFLLNGSAEFASRKAVASFRKHMPRMKQTRKDHLHVACGNCAKVDKSGTATRETENDGRVRGTCEKKSRS